MYSVVLMAAMTTTPAMPDAHRHGHGCCGAPVSCGCEGGHGGKHHKHRGHGCCGGNECGGGCGASMGCGCCGGGMMGPMHPMGPGGNAPPPREGAAPAGGGSRPMGMANPNAATLVVTGAK